MKRLYANAILVAYPLLEKKIKEIDRLVLRKALNAMENIKPAESQCQFIVDLIKEKDVLIKLLVAVEDSLSTFSKESLTYLEFKFFRKMPKSSYQKIKPYSRYYFRVQQRLLDKFAKDIDLFGVTDKDFEKNYIKFSFIRQIVRQLIKQLSKDVSNENKVSLDNKIKIPA